MSAALLLGARQSRLDILEAALSQVGWTVTAEQDPQEALKTLKSAPFEAIFCDEHLRGASPAGLLVWIRRLLPDTPFYFFTNVQDAKRFRTSGEPSALFHFPPVAGQLPSPAGGALSPVRAEGEDIPLSGNTSLVPLADLIEMLSLSKQEGVIELGKLGAVTLKGSKIEHAISFGTGSGSGSRGGLSTGIQALAQLIQTDECSFRVQPYKVPHRLTINLHTTTAMTEAARTADELRRFEGVVKTLEELGPLEGVAIGYAAASSPSVAVGAQGEAMFTLAKTLLGVNRKALSAKVNHMFLETESLVYILSTFGESNLLICGGPLASKGKLYRRVQELLKAEK